MAKLSVTRLSKPSHLEASLQRLHGFSSPRAELEQYTTPAHIAAHLLCGIERDYGDVRGRRVLDLGCGCGTLAIGCLLLGAERALGVDVDETALDLARENARDLELPHESLSLVCCDVTALSEAEVGGATFDIAIMNPPFGANRAGQRGIDTVFVQKALAHANRVYSLHKSSTRQYWLRQSAKLQADVEPVMEVRWNLDTSFKFHRQTSTDIEVDLLRFSRRHKKI